MSLKLLNELVTTFTQETKIEDAYKNDNELNKLSKSLPKGYHGIDIELQDFYTKLLAEMPEPKLVFKYFMKCLETPRPSGKLDKMRNVLKSLANKLGVTYNVDKVGNVCLRKPGSKNYENAPGVIIQCHMDMVCTKTTDDFKFDFENDSIKAYIDQDIKWLKAENTTLGADDGIGIAAGLSLFEHPNLIHGPIELLITIDEETTMLGAQQLSAKPFLKNNILINVDSEDDHKICIGCAGAFNKEIVLYMNTQTLNNQCTVYNICISGLRGGHTGVDIHLGRANALKLICRLLNYLISDKKIKLQLIEMSGGNAPNAIPSYAKCCVAIPNKLTHKFEEYALYYWNTFIIKEFCAIENDEKIKLDIIRIENYFKCNDNKIYDFESTNYLITLLMILPHGVIRMSPFVQDLVQTSISFSLFDLNKNSNKAICKLSGRSMDMNEMEELNRKLNSLKTLFSIGNKQKNIRIEINENMSDVFPNWLPILSSNALQQCVNAHYVLFNKKKPETFAVHAGLECGFIMKQYPYMDCISIGPLIKNAHSTDEKLQVQTVSEFYQWLTETVTRIAML